MFRTRRHTSLFRKKSTEPNAFHLPTSQLIFKSLKNIHPQCTIAIRQRHRSRQQWKEDDDDVNDDPHDDGERRPLPHAFESRGDDKSRS